MISAVGHETDFTIADFVADLRAPTPSAAAEIAVPSQLELISKISMMENRLKASEINIIKNKRLYIEKLSVSTPQDKIDDYRQRIDNLLKQAEKSFSLSMSERKKMLSNACAKLDALSPLAVMARGYAIAAENDGTVIRSAKGMKSGMEFTLKFSDGDAECLVK